MNIKTTTNIKDPAEFIANSILQKLEEDKKVLFFVTGGSSVAVGAKVAEFLKDKDLKNLTVMMTDERYGPVGHIDSNWAQLLQKGFDLPEAKLIPVLMGDSEEVTTEKFNKNLEEEFNNAKYKIGLFGLGADGHTAGNLPGSESVISKDLAFGYNTRAFYRITMTPKAIEKLDEIVVWAQGENKWTVLKNLIEKDINIIEQPVQVLKKVSLLTIFSDFKS